MIKLYKKTKRSTRLLFLGALVVLGISISIAYAFPVLLVAGGIIVAGLIIEVLVYKPRQIFSVLILAVEIAFMSVTALEIGQLTSSIQQDGNLALLTTEYVSLLSIVLLVLMAFWVSSGRLWFNLIVSFVLYNSAFILLIAMGLNYVYALILSFLLGAAYLAIRGISFKKAIPFTMKGRGTAVTKKTLGFLKAKGLLVEKSSEPFIDFFAVTPDKDKIFAIYTLDIFKSFRISGNEIIIDENSIVTPLLEQIITSIKDYASDIKVSKNTFIPVILVHKNVIGSDSVNISVSSRRKKDKTIGTVYIVTQKGFGTLMSKSPSFTTKKDQVRLIKALKLSEPI
jgi:hypothetical protein